MRLGRRGYRARAVLPYAAFLGLLACGRVGVHLIPLDSGVDSGVPDGGAEACDTDLDSDGDEIPDCIDFCQGEPDLTEEGACACAAARADADQDGEPNC